MAERLLNNGLKMAAAAGNFLMKRKSFPFEKLEVWQDARRLVKQAYQATSTFPKAETYNLASQINRAVVSVASNLAEGCTRSSLKDQAHFSNLAYSSLVESACQVILSDDLRFIPSEKSEALLSCFQDVSVRIHNLRESQLHRAKSG